MTKKIDLAVIPGDGIGPEVVGEALETLRVLCSGVLDFEVTKYELGAQHYLDTGEILSDETLGQLASHDAIFLGAIGGDPQDPRLRGGIIERGLLLKLRFAFDHYVNLRPTILFPGAKSVLSNPESIDFVVVREGTEGPYVGNGGSLRPGTKHEIATEVSVNSAYGVSRIVRFAFEKARARRKKLTLVHKTNVLVYAGNLWSRLVTEAQVDFPDIEVDYLHIDAATIAMVNEPSRFDVILTDNLFGDILTDLGGAIGGGIGLAASANLNPEGNFPNMYEPVHGSAPSLAGTGKANPVASFLSVAMMLQDFGNITLANRLIESISELLLAKQGMVANLGCREIGDEVRHNINVS